MNEFINNFHFLRPYWLVLIILPVIFYWKFFKGSHNKSSWETVVDKRLLKFLLLKGSSGQRKIVSAMAFVGYIFAVLSLAGPTWQKKEVPTLLYDNPVMILLNISSDMYETDISPNRLTRAKHKIHDLTKQISNTQAGLIVYTDEPYLITPITDDLKIIGNLMPAIELDIMPTNGDRLDRAIKLAVDRFKEAKYTFGNIIIISSDVGQQFNQALEEARVAEDFDYNVNVLSVTKENNEKLQMVAKKGNGIYTKITATDDDVLKISERIDASISDELKTSENLSSQWLDFGYYLLIVPMLCCLYFFRKGLMIIVLIFYASNVQAGFLLNNNQQGLRYFIENDFEAAVNKFKNSEWRGSAYYRMGLFDKAYEEFSKNNDIEAIYNQGNALAKAGKIEEAIKKYEEVLDIDVEHEDAKFNLEYLKQQQEQQSQSSNNDNDEQQDEEQDTQQDSSSSESNQKEDEQDSEQQNDSQSENTSENQDKEEQEEQSAQQEEEKQKPNSNEQESEDNQSQSTGLEDSDKDQYDEEVQAREMQYREIPEDPGGLLRAFIQKEYNKKRYGE